MMIAIEERARRRASAVACGGSARFVMVCGTSGPGESQLRWCSGDDSTARLTVATKSTPSLFGSARFVSFFFFLCLALVEGGLTISGVFYGRAVEMMVFGGGLQR
jgi:hypothetical protein